RGSRARSNARRRDRHYCEAAWRLPLAHAAERSEWHRRHVPGRAVRRARRVAHDAAWHIRRRCRVRFLHERARTRSRERSTLAAKALIVAGRWSWVALGVGAYVAFVAAKFPAAAAVQWFVPNEISVAGVRGTLWSGSASAVGIDGFPLRDVRWQVRPSRLLLGRIDAALEARLPEGFVSTDLIASPSSMRFANLRGGASLPSLNALLPVRGMRGQASVVLDSLELEGDWPARVVGELRVTGLE